MDDGVHAQKILVLGVGNTLMQDDGVGIHVIEALAASSDSHPDLQAIDGGTIGLALLPEIEDAAAVIIVDVE